MSTILQNPETLNSFTCEMEKNALNIGKIVSRINPFRRAGKKVAQKAAEQTRWQKAGKELLAVPVVAGGVTLAGLGYGAVTLPPRI